MRIRSSTTIAALFVIAGTGMATAQTVVVTPEQQMVIREYVQSRPVASVELLGIELSLGATVPETVELHPIDAPEINYRYIVVDDRTVLVEPETRQIIQILD